MTTSTNSFDKKKSLEEAKRDQEKFETHRKLEEEHKKALKRTLLEQQIHNVEINIRKQEMSVTGIKWDLEQLQFSKKPEGKRPSVVFGKLAELKTQLAKLEQEIRRLEAEEHTLQSKEVGPKHDAQQGRGAQKIKDQEVTARESLARENQEVAILKQREQQLQRELKSVEQRETELECELAEIVHNEYEETRKAKDFERGMEAAKRASIYADELATVKDEEGKKESDLAHKKREGMMKQIATLKKQSEDMKRQILATEHETATIKMSIVDYVAKQKKLNREHELQTAERELIQSKQELSKLQRDLQATK